MQQLQKVLVNLSGILVDGEQSEGPLKGQDHKRRVAEILGHVHRRVMSYPLTTPLEVIVHLPSSEDSSKATEERRVVQEVVDHIGSSGLFEGEFVVNCGSISEKRPAHAQPASAWSNLPSATVSS